MLTGVFGCGKTLIGQVVLKELNQERYRAVVIRNPRLEGLDFLRMVAHHLGVAHPPTSKADLLIGLEELLTDNEREGRETVIVVDEAQSIDDPKVFEEFRLLLNFQREDRFLVTLLLFGQPELAQVVNQNKPLEQRISLKTHLGPLSDQETRQYICHRLRVAGHPQPEGIFSTDALGLIYESSGGIPRRINRLCDILLLAAAGLSQRTVEAPLVADEVKGLAAT